MATRFAVLLETDPAPELTNQVRQALRHLGPCEVFMVADTTDEVADVINEVDEVEDEEPEPDPETCPACGQAIVDENGDALEDEDSDAEESEDDLDE